MIMHYITLKARAIHLAQYAHVRMPKVTLYFESVFNSCGTAALCTLLTHSQITPVWTDQISATSFPQRRCQLWSSQHENWNK